MRGELRKRDVTLASIHASESERHMKTTGNTTQKARRGQRLVAMLLAAITACTLGTMAAAWAAGLQTTVAWYTDNPDATEYTIGSIGELKGLSDLVNGYAVYDDGDAHAGEAISATSFEGKTVKLASNLNLGYADEFYPIGTADHPFAGTFDGQGHVISHLALTDSEAALLDYQDIGLFGHASATSTIENLTLEDSCAIELTATDPQTTVRNVGAAVGSTDGTIANVNSRARIDITWDDGENGATRAKENAIVVRNVGGVAGVARGSITGAVYSGSIAIYTPANATYDTSTGQSDAIVVAAVGGIVGHSGPDAADVAQAITSNAPTADLASCTNIAPITIYTTGQSGKDRFGETVSAKSTLVGGIAGYASGNIASCANEGTIQSSSYVPNATDKNIEHSIYGTAFVMNTYLADGGGVGVGGIVGSWRSTTQLTNGSASRDPGVQANLAAGLGQEAAITLSDCTNTGYVQGLNNVGGIAGTAGSYTTVTRCINGDATRSGNTAYADTGRVMSTRWNKPCTGGIVGQGYGTINFSRNHAEVHTTQGGYYTGGIVGYQSYQKDLGGNRAQPLPEVYSCYNTGQVHSNILNNSDSLNREGSLVGGNDGTVHDCLFLFGTLNKSDDPENAAIGENYGTYARVQVAYATQRSADNNSEDPERALVLTTKYATAFLNTPCKAADNWDLYWVTNGAVNRGYPILGTAEDADGSMDLTTLSPTAELLRNARYTAAYNPTPTLKVVITVDGERQELVENADYVVVADPAAAGQGITTDGTRPYKATVRGIGSFRDTPDFTVDYAIEKGDFSECTVSAAPATYTGEPLNSPEVTVLDAGGGVVPPSSYELVVNDGKDCVEPTTTANIYYVTAKALEDSNYFGSAQGEYTINKIDIARDCDVIGFVYENRVWYYNDESYALYEVTPQLDGEGTIVRDDAGVPQVEGAETYIADDGRVLTRATPKQLDENGLPAYGMALDYTGAKIEPALIGVNWQGEPLDESWYRVFYGTGDEDGFAGGLPNIEASTTGVITVAYDLQYTSNYDRITFEILPIEVSADELAITQVGKTLTYNGGAQVGTPEITMKYNDTTVAASNYKLVPDHSIDSAGVEHYGANITYNIGDEIYYRIEFTSESSVQCADINVDTTKMRHWTVIENQISLNEDVIDVQLVGGDRAYTLQGAQLPELVITNTAQHYTLQEGVDYEFAVYNVQPNVTFHNGVTARPYFQIRGVGEYAGTRVEYYNMTYGSIDGADLDACETADVVNLFATNATIGAVEHGAIVLPYRNNGYSQSEIGPLLGLVWVEDEGVSGHSNRIVQAEGSDELKFEIEELRDAQGNIVDEAKSPGTYTAVIVKSDRRLYPYQYSYKYFDLADNFRVERTIEVVPVNLATFSSFSAADGSWHLAGLAYDQDTLFLSCSKEMSLRNPLVSSNAVKFTYEHDGTQCYYTGNPVVPQYRILDSEGAYFRLLTSRWDAAGGEQDLSDCAFPNEDLVISVVNYGTMGPTEVGQRYEVSEISAREGCDYLVGSRKTTGIRDRYFDIVACDLTDEDQVKIEVDTETYSGSALEPAVRFYVNDEECNYILGSDYAVTYANNIEAGDVDSDNPPMATITILNHNHLVAYDENGNQIDSITVPFTIERAPVSLATEVDWQLGESIALNDDSGSTTLVAPSLVGTYTPVGSETGEALEVPQSAYTVETGVYNSAADEFTVKASGWAVGDQVWVRVQAAKDQEAFRDSKVLGPVTVVAATSANSFAQVGQPGNALVVSLDSATSSLGAVYAGAQIRPSVTASDGVVPLVLGRDYALVYGPNVNVADGGSVTVVGIGAYTGSCTLPFNIVSRAIDTCTIDIAEQTYTGEPIEPSGESIGGSIGDVVLPESDYAIAGYGDNVAVGQASGTVTLEPGVSGNLIGQTTVTFDIVPIALDEADEEGVFRFDVQADEHEYNGKPIELGAQDLTVIDTHTDVSLEFGVDFTINYPGDHESAGEREIVVSGLGNYMGNRSASFTVTPKELTEENVSLEIDEIAYTGAGVEPEVNVVDGETELYESYVSSDMQIIGDYKLTWENNVDVAAADGEMPPRVTVEGTGNYTGSVSLTFSIVPAVLSSDNATIVLDNTVFRYSSAGVEPKTRVLFNGVELPSTDYEVSYEDNGQVGTATVKAMALAPNFDVAESQRISATYQIEPALLSTCKVAAISDQRYNYGEPVEPTVEITAPDGTKLRNPDDFTVAYADNSSVGTATVTITAAGNWTGSTTKTFSIARISITASDVSLSATSFTYDGKTHEPQVSIMVDGRTLTQGSDYDVRFLGDRKSVGSQVVEITTPDTSVYSSTATASYAIVEPEEEKPANPTTPTNPTNPSTPSNPLVPGKPIWSDDDQKPSTPTGPAAVRRYAGENALGTMQAIVQAGFSSSDVVVVATMDGYWDALAASALAGANDAPVLLTDPSSLSAEARSEIKRLKATKVFIVGGPAAVSTNVESQLRSMGCTVDRLWGANAQQTAIAIADKVSNRGTTCIIATSYTFQDALSASPYAYSNRCPIYLTDASGNLASSTLTAISKGGYTRAVIAGGPAAVSSASESQLRNVGIKDVSRQYGETAYETSGALASWALGQGMTVSQVGVATCTGYWDALTGAALCGKNNSVLLLADDGKTGNITSIITPRKSSVSYVNVFGGTAAVGAAAYSVCERAVK